MKEKEKVNEKFLTDMGYKVTVSEKDGNKIFYAVKNQRKYSGDTLENLWLNIQDLNAKHPNK